MKLVEEAHEDQETSIIISQMPKIHVNTDVVLDPLNKKVTSKEE